MLVRNIYSLPKILLLLFFLLNNRTRTTTLLIRGEKLVTSWSHYPCNEIKEEGEEVTMIGRMGRKEEEDQGQECEERGLVNGK